MSQNGFFKLAELILNTALLENGPDLGLPTMIFQKKLSNVQIIQIVPRPEFRPAQRHYMQVLDLLAILIL